MQYFYRSCGVFQPSSFLFHFECVHAPDILGSCCDSPIFAFSALVFGIPLNLCSYPSSHPHASSINTSYKLYITSSQKSNTAFALHIKTSTLAHHILYTFTTRTVAHSFSHNIVPNITIGIITQVNHWFFSSSHHHTVTTSHSLTLYSMAILSPRRSRAALRSTVRYIHTYIHTKAT